MGAIWSLIKGCLMFIGAVVVILAIVVGVLVWNFTQPTELQKEMRPVEITQQAAEELEQKVETFVADLTDPANVGTEVAITITEEELSSAANQMLDEYKDEMGLPLDIEEIQINFIPGSVHLVIAIKGNIFGLNVNLAAKGWVDLREEGDSLMLYYKIEELDLGRAPSQLKQLVQDNIGDRMEGSQEMPADFNLDLEDFDLVAMGDKYALQIKGKVSATGPVI